MRETAGGVGKRLRWAQSCPERGIGSPRTRTRTHAHISPRLRGSVKISHPILSHSRFPSFLRAVSCCSSVEALSLSPPPLKWWNKHFTITARIPMSYPHGTDKCALRHRAPLHWRVLVSMVTDRLPTEWFPLFVPVMGVAAGGMDGTQSPAGTKKDNEAME